MNLTDLGPNLLVQTPENEVLKISTVYPTYVTAQVVYPIPGRTAVRTCLLEEIAKWREPSDYMLGKYERAWGYAR